MAKLKTGTRIYGTATIDTSVVVGSAVTLSSSGVNVTGISTLNNANATQLQVSGVSTFTGLLDANGGATIDNIRIGIANDNTIDTNTGGLTLDSNSGTITVNDNLAISGSNALSFNSSSFNISHSGGNANLFNGLGDLILGADGDRSIRLERVGVATLARFTHNGSAELYYIGSKKLETTGYGATVFGGLQVSGVVTATSFSGSGTNLTGIVTSIVAGTNITVSGSTGQVTINSTATGGGGAALDILEVMLFA